MVSNSHAPLLTFQLERWRNSRLIRYGLAIATVCIATGGAISVKLAIGEDGHPLTLLVLGVVISTWYGGFGPGVLATALSAVTAKLFLIGPNFIETGEVLNIVLLVGVSMITASLYSALRGAHAVEKDLHEEVTAAEELVGFVSHELRNPATVIGGNIRLLSRHPEIRKNDALLSVVTIVEDEAKELADTIEQLLVLSTHGHHSAAAKEPVLLPRVLARQVETHRARFPHRPISLACDDSCALIEANSEHVNLILRNFLENAEKYSPDPRAPLEVIACPKPGNKVAISVNDRGIGISPSEADHVFDSFYRSDAVRSQKPGFGLGLTVCKRLAESAGGNIWAKPRSGGGSEFGFTVDALVLHGEDTE